MSSIFNKTNIVVIIIIIVLGLVYYFYFGNNPVDTSAVLGPQQIATSTMSSSDQFLITLKSLKRINLDGSIFDNPTFTGLQDFSTNLPDQPVGRINPFSPTGRDASVATTTSKNPAK